MNHVYVVKRNADMTEGRGPMMLHSIFSNRAEAETFIDNQPGVMGRREQWSRAEYGDWTINEMPVYDFAHDLILNNEKELRKKALAKLSAEEKRARIHSQSG